MKVLVTGGSGFLGINLIRFLRTKGVEEIRVLDIADFDYPEKSEPWLKFTLGDVRDVPAVDRVVEHARIAAAVSKGQHRALSDLPLNIDGFVAVEVFLNEAAGKGARSVVASF